MKKIYLRVCSDLHLEGFLGRNLETLALDFLPSDKRDSTSILVLAGDISSNQEQLVGFIRVCSIRFAHVLYVPGNHEYYRHDFNVWNDQMGRALAALNDNDGQNKISFCLDGLEEVVFGKTRFLLTTLWGDGGKTPSEQMLVDHSLNDFRVIRLGESRFKVQNMMALHREQKRVLVEKLKTSFDGQTIVITHHLPSYRLCHPRFGNEINGGFASDCDDILAYDHAPGIWIHGHTHDTGDGFLWKTRIVCNPAGYRGEWNTPFNIYHVDPKFIKLYNE